MKTQELVKIIGSVSTVMILVFGISLATGIKKVHKMFSAPIDILMLQHSDSVMDHEIHDLIHAQEFTWDLLRLMTDNHDSSLIYRVTDDNNITHDVDIRETAEGVELAFVFDYFVVFQIRHNNADNRRFINVHNYDTGETDKYYIE